MSAPAQQVAALYDTDSPRTFREDVEAHMVNGYMWATPDVFLMARPIDSTALPDDIANPWHAFPRETQDTWLIYAYADNVKHSSYVGLVKKVLRYMPYPLKKAAWARKRDERLRFFDIEKFLRLTHENIRPMHL